MREIFAELFYSFTLYKVMPLEGQKVTEKIFFVKKKRRLFDAAIFVLLMILIK